ncbi:Permease of the drug/metabolite transporter (DMT) superfamily [Prevotella aff. ruminicola Tc2-24]|uniref:Permease of the drug/metabolite transporter (DMT) superfamily n=1 Tax=Prevotella aff. ruminicola Tc2-24 TaxID=81582 RepID=A0A1I0PWR5_9BACT|nr:MULTISPECIES: DMT family transporter [Prevotella]SEE61346.1 Permease of the drug/metabolite transporter (DMT) superfamily [Prevotella sp. lc2012]SEW19012.1 Permease of the drug/metabolite transporter (DMT) superfamily [Prevotella aff. ruminicola Tc2-24]
MKKNLSRQNRVQAHGAIFLANTIFGLGVPVTKLLLNDWVTPMGYMASRSLGACLVFWLIAAFLPKEKVERKDLVTILIGGLLGFVISQTLTAWALDYTSPVYFSLIATLTPVAVMLCAALTIGERITSMKFVGVLLGIGGAVLMVLMSQSMGSGKNDLLGIILAILSVLTWAVYLIITRNVASKYSPVTQMKYVFLISAIVTVPIALPELSQNALYTPAWDWYGVLEMAFIVLCATALGYFLIPYAMKYLQATTVSIYTNLQPVIASFVAIILGQDILTWDKPVAGILVLLSAYIVTVVTAKEK